jgi:hypothetical protein
MLRSPLGRLLRAIDFEAVIRSPIWRGFFCLLSVEIIGGNMDRC